MKIYLKLIIPFTLAILSQATVYADVVEDEINALIDEVARSGCQFTRNGSDHNAEDAADHLRLKYRRGKRYASSAENFIDRLASESSWTDKPYMMTCPDSGEQTANAWLHASLADLRRAAQ